MENVSFEVIGEIGVVKINRLESMNSLNFETVSELRTLISKVNTDPNLKVLIIGSEKHFAAGGDVKAMIECNVHEARAFSFSDTFREIEQLDIPTIAAINGYALGGGLELALACDFRIASPKAKLGFPEINLGIMPGAGGTIRAPRLIGEAKAKELIFMGEIIDAFYGEKIGLINKVSEQEDAMILAMEWGKKLCEKAPIALRTAKESIQKGMEYPSLEAALFMEEVLWADLFCTEDQKEGMRAFLEKRRPNYKGGKI